MQLGKIYTAQPDFENPHIIEIEVDISSQGIPSCTIVGLADKAIDESKERIAAALKNSGLSKIKQKKIVVSLSPANLKKEGPLFDLPIALGMLLADSENELSFDTQNKLFVGELSLDGSIKPIEGALSIAYGAQAAGYTEVFLPQANAQEASLLSDISIYGVSHIIEVVQHLSQESAETPNPELVLSPATYKPSEKLVQHRTDFSDVIDQQSVKRVLEIAAAGGHNVAMYGPPGTGKTMLAQAFCSILPKLSTEQQIKTTMIHSCAGVLKDQVISHPPLRAPHHTSSYVSVIGGGAEPRPGEITLAHHGVLFLDEFPEFDKRVLESLREPLEEKHIRIARSKASVTFPADFILVAALNPPSEVYRSGSLITPADERRFRKKLSGPIMDRVDLWVEVPKINHSKLLVGSTKGESSVEIQKRVVMARAKQATRLGTGRLNNSIHAREIRTLSISSEAKQVLDTASKKLDVSPRVYHKLLKLSQTIADLEGSNCILPVHILEALQYRPKDIL